MHALRGLLLLLAALLAGCSDAPRPDLKRLYQFGMRDADATPVILIPGAFG